MPLESLYHTSKHTCALQRDVEVVAWLPEISLAFQFFWESNYVLFLDACCSNSYGYGREIYH
jgi:hypothetical protein